MKTYICPSCRKKQYKVREWRRGLFSREFNLKTGKMGIYYQIGDNSEHKNWACPNCDANLPFEIIDGFIEQI